MTSSRVAPQPASMALHGTVGRANRRRMARISANPVTVAAIVLFFFLQFGLISLVGLGDLIIGQELASALLLAGLCIAPFKRRQPGFSLSRIEDVFPISLFLLMIAVSYISNNWIFGFGFENWLLYSYVLIPALTYYLLWTYSVSARDIIVAVIIMGVISSIIVIFDAFFEFSALNTLQRYTNGTGVRRVTILKNEVVLACLFMLSEILGDKVKSFGRFLAISGAVLTFYVVAFRFESRLASLALVSALVPYVFSARKLSNRQRLYVIIGVILIISVASSLCLYYIEPFLNQSVDDYIANNNVEIRIRANNYYLDYFYQTFGVGFGAMTLNINSGNFQAAGAPIFYNIADLGIFGGLYQFGIGGLILIVGGTLTLVFRCLQIGRMPYHPYRDEIRMVGCYVFGFMLQPIPMNFFTLNWTILLGSTLWYLMRRAMWETKQLQKSS